MFPATSRMLSQTCMNVRVSLSYRIEVLMPRQMYKTPHTYASQCRFMRTAVFKTISTRRCLLLLAVDRTSFPKLAKLSFQKIVSR